MDLQIVDSDAKLPNRKFVTSVDADMILFQRACIANPGNLACIIRDMIANLNQLTERNQVQWNLVSSKRKGQGYFIRTKRSTY